VNVKGIVMNAAGKQSVQDPLVQIGSTAPAPLVERSPVLHHDPVCVGVRVTGGHPLAQAIFSGTKERGISPVKTADFESITGTGGRGIVNGRNVLFGNRALLEEFHIPITDQLSKTEELRSARQTVMFVAVDGKAAGLVGVADPVKASTPEAVALLHKEGRLITLGAFMKEFAAANAFLLRGVARYSVGNAGTARPV
jgi:hypothetical protein